MLYVLFCLISSRLVFSCLVLISSWSWFSWSYVILCVTYLTITHPHSNPNPNPCRYRYSNSNACLTALTVTLKLTLANPTSLTRSLIRTYYLLCPYLCIFWQHLLRPSKARRKQGRVVRRASITRCWRLSMARRKTRNTSRKEASVFLLLVLVYFLCLCLS